MYSVVPITSTFTLCSLNRSSSGRDLQYRDLCKSGLLCNTSIFLQLVKKIVLLPAPTIPRHVCVCVCVCQLPCQYQCSSLVKSLPMLSSSFTDNCWKTTNRDQRGREECLYPRAARTQSAPANLTLSSSLPSAPSVHS